ncbi:MAG: hypothetical protein QM756_38740 [Polyangiaceae bacterium]
MVGLALCVLVAAHPLWAKKPVAQPVAPAAPKLWPVPVRGVIPPFAPELALTKDALLLDGKLVGALSSASERGTLESVKEKLALRRQGAEQSHPGDELARVLSLKLSEAQLLGSLKRLLAVAQQAGFERAELSVSSGATAAAVSLNLLPFKQRADERTEKFIQLELSSADHYRVTWRERDIIVNVVDVDDTRPPPEYCPNKGGKKAALGARLQDRVRMEPERRASRGRRSEIGQSHVAAGRRTDREAAREARAGRSHSAARRTRGRGCQEGAGVRPAPAVTLRGEQRRR